MKNLQNKHLYPLNDCGKCSCVAVDPSMVTDGCELFFLLFDFAFFNIFCGISDLFTVMKADSNVFFTDDITSREREKSKRIVNKIN